MFDEIKAGLNEAIECEKGNLKTNTRTLSITSVEAFTASEIKAIRKNTEITQVSFPNKTQGRAI